MDSSYKNSNSNRHPIEILLPEESQSKVHIDNWKFRAYTSQTTSFGEIRMKKNRKMIRIITAFLPVVALLAMGLLMMIKSEKSSDEILSTLSHFKFPLG